MILVISTKIRTQTYNFCKTYVRWDQWENYTSFIYNDMLLYDSFTVPCLNLVKPQLVGRSYVCILWHINLFSVFKAKSISYK